MRKIKLILFFVVSSMCAYSQSNIKTEFLDIDEYKRSFEIYLPNNYSPHNSYPLVFVLHGGGGTAKGLVRSTNGRFNQLANRDSFIVVYPNGIEKGWNDGKRDTIGMARKLNIDDVKFFEKMIEKFRSELAVDTANTFACGISNGGFMVQRLAAELPGKLKGIAIVAANMSKVQAEKKFPQEQVSVLFINGTADPIIPFNGGFVKVFKQNRGAVLSVAGSVETWKECNGCTAQGNFSPFPDKNSGDNCTATKTEWTNPENPKIKVTAITIENGGHTWPGTKRNLPVWLTGNMNRDFNGCDEIWSFFKSLK